MLVVRIMLALCLALFVYASPAHAAVAREGTPVECTDAVAGDTVINCTMTIGSVSNGLLLCSIMSNNNADINPSIAWDTAGVNEALTMVTNAEDSTNRYGSIWYLKNPTAGSSKTIGLTGLSGAARDGVICAFYSGVDQTTPTDCGGCSDSGNVDDVEVVSTSISSATITSGAGEILFGCMSKANAATVTWDTGSGNAEIHFQAVGTGGHGCADDADGADDLINGTWTGSSSTLLLTVNINAAAAGGGATISTRAKGLLGVGK